MTTSRTAVTGTLTQKPQHTAEQLLSTYGFDEGKIRKQKEVGQNADRTLTPAPAFNKTLKTTDENGWLVFYHLSGGPSRLPEALEGVGNHPSVIAWQVWGNGYVNGPHGHPMQIGGVVPVSVRSTDRAYQVAQELRQQDPTGRLVFFYRLGTGGDFRGIMTTLGWGTPIQTIEEWPSYWAKTKQDPLVPTEMQIVIPRSHELEIWQRGSRHIILAEHHARYSGDAAYEKLTRKLVGALRPTDETLSPWAKSPHAFDVAEMSFGRALRSWRSYGISGYLFHVEFKTSSTHEGNELNRHGLSLRKNNSPFLFYVSGEQRKFVSKDHHYSGGDLVRKSATFVNDTFHDVAGRLTWEAHRGETRIASETRELSIPQGRVHFHPIEFRCPSVKQKAKVVISARFEGDGGDISADDSFALSVFPAVPPLSLAGRVALIDSTGETGAVLRKCGVAFQLVNEDTIDRGVTSLARYAALIIGKNSYSEAAKIFREWLPIDETVREGLNIICLEQLNRHVMGLQLENFNARRAFIRAKDSPLFAGFDDGDFADWNRESRLLPAYPPWNKDRDWRTGKASKHGQRNSFGQLRYWHWSNRGMVATFAFEKPQRGNFRVLMDCGFDLLYTPLVEFWQGRGRVLLNQLDLVDHYGIDPVATLLFRRILEEYTKPHGRVFGKLTCLGGKKGQGLLEEVGCEYEPGIAPQGKVVFLDPQSFQTESSPDLPEQLAAYLNGGGVVVLNGSFSGAAGSAAQPGKTTGPPDLQNSEPEDQGKDEPDDLDRLVEDAGAAERRPARRQVDVPWAWMLPVPLPAERREVFRSRVPLSPLFSGLGMSDFYWRGSRRFHSVKAGTEDATDTGLMGVVPVGKGKLVFVQFALDDFESPWQRSKVLRIYSTLLTHLNVRSVTQVEVTSLGGLGQPEEWLPGYATESMSNRPSVERSAFYGVQPLSFDPYQHHVW